jgi:vacuolar protein sorting-associated protein 13A/C
MTYFYFFIQEMLKRKVTKPYSPIADGSSAEVAWKEGICTWSPQQVPGSVLLSSTFGSSTDEI